MTRRTGLIATAFLVGCGGPSASQQALTPPQAGAYAQQRSVRSLLGSRGWLTPDANAKHPWLYVTGNQDNQVGIYDLKRLGVPKVGAITQGISSPADVAVDSQGTVYVANETGTVTIYPAGSTSPSLTLSQGLYSPQGVAADVNGDVYVANRGPAPSIQVYAKGQTTPYETITGSLIQVPSQMVFDAQRNLYIGDNNTLAYRLPVGSRQVQSLNLQYMTSGGGVALDQTNGNLFIYGVAGNVHSFWGYAPGNPHPAYFFNGGAAADSLAVGKVDRHRFVFVPDSGMNTVAVYDEGKKRPRVTITTDVHYLVGVAFKPAGVP